MAVAPSLHHRTHVGAAGAINQQLGVVLERTEIDIGPGVGTIVGVNRFQTDEPPPEVEGYELDEKGRTRQLERLAGVKRSRSAADVGATLAALATAAAKDDENLMPCLIDCAKAYCTVGEMVDVLKDQWGEFQQPVVF